MHGSQDVDPSDARLLLALAESPRATVLALAEQVGMSRNTVQARLAGLETARFLRSSRSPSPHRSSAAEGARSGPRPATSCS